MCGAVCFVIQCGSNFLVCRSNHAVRPFFAKLLNITFMWCCLFCDTVRFLLFSLWIKPCSVTILWKAVEQYFTVLLSGAKGLKASRDHFGESGKNKRIIEIKNYPEGRKSLKSRTTLAHCVKSIAIGNKKYQNK